VPLSPEVVAYTVLIWYNAPLNNGKKKVPCAPIVRAAFMGLTYHLGSLAFGAALASDSKALAIGSREVAHSTTLRYDICQLNMYLHSTPQIYPTDPHVSTLWMTCTCMYLRVQRCFATGLERAGSAWKLDKCITLPLSSTRFCWLSSE
jgi:hypothetical protein